MRLTEEEDLKVFAWREGKEWQLPLLLTPGSIQVRVPDEDAGLHPRVQVESDVLIFAIAEVDRETVRVRADLSFYCDVLPWAQSFEYTSFVRQTQIT